MAVHYNYENNVLTAYLKGEIDHHSAKGMREDIDKNATQYRPKLLRLDFTGIGFMDSSGIGLVMGRYKTMLTLGGKIEVLNTSPHITKVMKLAGLQKLKVI